MAAALDGLLEQRIQAETEIKILKVLRARLCKGAPEKCSLAFDAYPFLCLMLSDMASHYGWDAIRRIEDEINEFVGTTSDSVNSMLSDTMQERMDMYYACMQWHGDMNPPIAIIYRLAIIDTLIARRQVRRAEDKA